MLLGALRPEKKDFLYSGSLLVPRFPAVLICFGHSSSLLSPFAAAVSISDRVIDGKGSCQFGVASAELLNSEAAVRTIISL